MMRIPNLALRTVTLTCLAVALPTIPVLAQERLVFRVSAENTNYTQQHTIDVADVAGHQVRIFEIKRVYPTNAPLIGGVKNEDSGTRGSSAYTNNSGEAKTYKIYGLESGAKFFSRVSVVASQSPEASTLTGC